MSGNRSNPQRIGKTPASDLNGTKKQNKVAKKELSFWLPLTWDKIGETIPKVSTVEELAELPKAQIGHILAAVTKIIRKQKVVKGERFASSSLKNKVTSWQRIIRNYYAASDSKKKLCDPNFTSRTLDVWNDPELECLVLTLNKEMEASVSAGLGAGLAKKARSPVKPAHIRDILRLYNTSVPADMEHCFGVMLLLQLGNPGGEKLRSMHWGQFSEVHNKDGGKYWLFKPMKNQNFRHLLAGHTEIKATGDHIEIFNDEKKEDCFNPYQVIKTYREMLPRGWTEPTQKNPVFLTPGRLVKNGIGFKPVPRGRNVLCKLLQRAMVRIGVPGKYANQQIRETVIKAALGRGIEGCDSRESTINPYKLPNVDWRRWSQQRMPPLIAGGESWFCGKSEFGDFENELIESLGSRTMIEPKNPIKSEYPIPTKETTEKERWNNENWGESKCYNLRRSPDSIDPRGMNGFDKHANIESDFNRTPYDRLYQRRTLTREERDLALVNISRRNQELFKMMLNVQNKLLQMGSQDLVAKMDEIQARDEMHSLWESSNNLVQKRARGVQQGEGPERKRFKTLT